jgi:PAS domain S-box-containing protein
MLYVSPAFERVWGVPVGELLANPSLWLESVHPDDRPGVQHAVATQAGGGYDREYRIVRPDESIRWIRDRAFPVRNAQGGVYRIVGVAEDITERRRLEERFLRAQRMEVIGSLTSGITHDLNNVLSSMLMAAGLVKSRTREARDREMLVTIERGAQRGARMIAQLLAFSRGAEGVRASLRPDSVIEEAAGLVRATFPRGVDLQVKVDRPLHAVVADATQLHQVLMNLCVNARDAMPGGGRLVVTAENRELGPIEADAHPEARPGSYVVLKVSDTGAGIPAAILERIFDPFFTTKDAGKGTGLGLSSVLGIVRSHGGFVTVASELGKGSEFSVFLPASLESVSPFATGSAGPFPMGQGELVLVVDDESDIRKVTVGLLEAQKYRVLSAANGEEALTLFLQHADAVRAVLTNLHMPGMGGLALLQALRVLDYLSVGFVVASGDEGEVHDDEFARLGVAEFLPKPIPRARLLQAVAKAVATSVGAKTAKIVT